MTGAKKKAKAPKSAPAKKPAKKTAAAAAKPRRAARKAPKAKTPAKSSGPAFAERPEGVLTRIAAMREEMDNLFTSMSRSFGFPEIKMPAFDLPSAPSFADVRFEVSETDKAVEVKAEVPGLTEDEIEIELAEGMLTVKGEKRDSREEKKKDYHLSERRYGSFSRSFRVPETVIEDAITADLKNGVLNIALPKRAAQKRSPKPIKVSGTG